MRFMMKWIGRLSTCGILLGALACQSYDPASTGDPHELGEPSPTPPTEPAGTLTGDMAIPRAFHTATLLPDGRVLVVGGATSTVQCCGNTEDLASVELFDPASGTWSETGSLYQVRFGHDALLLPNGNVLVIGGQGSRMDLTSVESFDSSTETWSVIGSLTTPRLGATVTLLPDGTVLVAGGFNWGTELNSAERFDPATGTSTPAGPMVKARYYHTAALLANGDVLVAGGFNNGHLASSEVYDSVSGTWSEKGPMLLERDGFGTALLPSGKLLVIGSTHHDVVTELYDPSTGVWEVMGTLAEGRHSHTTTDTMTLGPNGRILAAGGSDASGLVTSSIEGFEPSTGAWEYVGVMAAARTLHTATLLPNGTILFAGGLRQDNFFLASAELY